MPSAYVFAEVEIKDPAIYAEYAQGTAKTIADHGGTWFLDNASRRELLEGEDAMPCFMSARFESYEQGLAWYRSEAYAPMKRLRQGAVIVRKLMLIEGLS